MRRNGSRAPVPPSAASATVAVALHLLVVLALRNLLRHKRRTFLDRRRARVRDRHHDPGQRLAGRHREPCVPDVVASGVDLVSFSGDKLLGGPQAGIVVGRTDLVERLTKNPLNRALRIDKFTVAALEGTLYAYEAGTALETIPTLRMLTEPLASIRRRAQGLLRRLPPRTRTELGAQVTETRSQVGGGALPTVELPTAALALGTATRAAHELDETLRSGTPRVLGRVVDDRLLLDCRTILAGDIAALAERLAAIA